MATGKYVYLLHSDDIIYSDGGFNDVSKYLYDERFDIIYGNSVYVNKMGNETRVYSFNKLNLQSLSNGLMPPKTTKRATN